MNYAKDCAVVIHVSMFRSLNFFNYRLVFVIFLRSPQKFTGNISIHETQYIRIVPSKS